MKRLITYGLGGVCTTIVNYVVYFGLDFLKVDYLIANTVAWIVAVIFSYAINRRVVFHSDGGWISEFFSFTGLRLITLAVENLLLYLSIEELGIKTGVAKIVVSIVTVLANYVICQKHIFGRKDETKNG